MKFVFSKVGYAPELTKVYIVTRGKAIGVELPIKSHHASNLFGMTKHADMVRYVRANILTKIDDKRIWRTALVKAYHSVKDYNECTRAKTIRYCNASQALEAMRTYRGANEGTKSLLKVDGTRKMVTNKVAFAYQVNFFGKSDHKRTNLIMDKHLDAMQAVKALVCICEGGQL